VEGKLEFVVDAEGRMRRKTNAGLLSNNQRGAVALKDLRQCRLRSPLPKKKQYESISGTCRGQIPSSLDNRKSSRGGKRENIMLAVRKGLHRGTRSVRRKKHLSQKEGLIETLRQKSTYRVGGPTENNESHLFSTESTHRRRYKLHGGGWEPENKSEGRVESL